MPYNEFQQKIGEPLPDFTPGAFPDVAVLTGRTVVLEHLDVEKHLEDIYDFAVTNRQVQDWTYLPVGPFETRQEVSDWLVSLSHKTDAYFFAIRDKARDRVVGLFSLMRINPASRTIEMGWVIYSPTLQHSIAATEAQYLAMSYVFEELQYRRYEWKCDALNQRSHQAALRLGFTFEGTFRQHTVYKGRSRDTSWFSILDKEWPAQKMSFERWLSPDNFDANGHQKKSLQD
ncbi:GNAT family acetyltransferase [Streptococcus criceti]|uniref:Acetyltransferase, GNAT family n=1 Tax=Streptococcus criceti HS-6 TaxID=873449 RepID=G5JNY4_STRCG|nr:GNAT family protein [Streptococcus criceti]EHI74202.1 acetyltransferase, GNAT family [Streptococcus criceti HS-6]SUN43395.1 GNAT family acetyltransferase [Streptococcus criceti]